MSTGVTTAGLMGARAELLTATAFVTNTPGGVFFPNVAEGQRADTAERVMGAIAATGLSLPALRTQATRSLASAPVHTPAHDVAYAVAILSEHNIVDVATRSLAFLGRLTTAGALAPVRGIYPMVRAIAAQGIAAVVVPAANADEARLVDGIHVYACATLGDVLAALGVNCNGKPVEGTVRDFSTIRGNQDAVNAVTIAAAGGHHLRLTGSVKHADRIITTMAGIMPTLDDATSDEATVIASLRGTLGHHRITRPPYAAPHATDSMASFIGGGAGIAQPGAVSAAHGGILHLSDAAEFPTTALHVLRQPLAAGAITLHRAYGAGTYPARFLLALTTADCPCGQPECNCSTQTRQRYIARLNALACDIGVTSSVTNGLRRGLNESTDTLAARVAYARAAAAERYADYTWSLNADASTRWLTTNTPKRLLNAVAAAQRGGTLTAQGAVTRLRVAWTHADMSGAAKPTLAHLEAASH